MDQCRTLSGSKIVLIISAALLFSQFALAGTNYFTWDDAKGFQSAQKCSLVESGSVPLYVVDAKSPSTELVISKGGQVAVPNRSIVRLLKKDSPQSEVQVVGLSTSGDTSLISEIGSISSAALKEIDGRVLSIRKGAPAVTFGHSNIPVVGSFLEVEMKDGSYLVSRCGSGDAAKGYMLFNVFTPDSKDPVLEIGLTRDQTKILEFSYGYTTAEAEALPDTKSRAATKASPTTGKTATVTGTVSSNATSTTPVSTSSGTSDQTGIAAKDETETTANTVQSAAITPTFVVCSPSGDNINVRDATLKKVIFMSHNGESVKPQTAAAKTAKISGDTFKFISVQFLNRHGSSSTGWIEQSSVQTSSQCSKTTPTVAIAKPIQLIPVPATPTPAPAPAPVISTNVTPGKAMNCAEETILTHAKVTERADFGRASESGGHCAFGVRLELQSSHVGGITDGIGDAIDFLAQLTKRGYVDSGVTDPNLAPAGAVIVFGGPNSKLYLSTNKKVRTAGRSNMAGNWAGHVTIKGDDGFYYTDARTREPAIGWFSGKNVLHIRNVFEILVPGSALVQQFSGKCPGMSI